MYVKFHFNYLIKRLYIYIYIYIYMYLPHGNESISIKFQSSNEED